MRTMDRLKIAARWQRGLSVIMVIGWALAAAWPALAQTATLTLSVSKTFGFNNGSQIQGSFRLEVAGPANLKSVTFTLDGQPLGQVSAAPFRYDLNTDQFAPGWHTVGASGQTADGQTLTAADRRYEFLSAAQAQSSLTRFMVPILGLVGLLVVVGLGSQLFFVLRGGKNRSALPLGAHRTYGVLGGTICPKCQRPFSIHWWALNALPTRRFDRCDHCGKWSLVHAVSPAELAKAERAELKYAQPTAPQVELSPEEKLKRELDSSRFDDQ